MQIPRCSVLLCSMFAAIATLATAAAENGSDRFYQLIRNNDLAKLKAWVSQGADVNTKDARDETPLMYAATVGSVEAMRLLLDQHANPNVQNMAGATALIWSATDLAKTQLLLDHGADPNLATRKGRTALLVAAMSDHSAPIVRLLIAHGANVQARDFLKTTALRAAAFGNDLETIRLLLDAGIDPNAVDLPGISPLMMTAGWNGNIEATKLLLSKGANVNAVSRPVMGLPTRIAPSRFGNLTALTMSAAFGPKDLIEALIGAGATVDAKDVRGMTPLMLAIANDHQDPDVIDLLLKHGADPTVKDAMGFSACDWARRFKDPEGLKLLKLEGEPKSAGVNQFIPVSSTSRELRPAIQRTIGLIEKSSAQFFAVSGCVSCHAQSMTDLAVGEARLKGIPTDEKAAEERFKMLKAIYPPSPS